MEPTCLNVCMPMQVGPTRTLLQLLIVQTPKMFSEPFSKLQANNNNKKCHFF
jgi:hypothetical protein